MHSISFDGRPISHHQKYFKQKQRRRSSNEQWWRSLAIILWQKRCISQSFKIKKKAFPKPNKKLEAITNTIALGFFVSTVQVCFACVRQYKKKFLKLWNWEKTKTCWKFRKNGFPKPETSPRHGFSEPPADEGIAKAKGMYSGHST